jgi:hypothetical protein
MCSITVNITNNTGQGPVTFNSFSFFSETKGKFSPGGAPYVVATTIPDSNQQVKALYAEGFVSSTSEGGIPADLYIYTEGTAVFNMPNGDSLTISWKLSPQSGANNHVPTLSPSSTTYNYSGLTSPVSSTNSDYVFNIGIS